MARYRTHSHASGGKVSPTYRVWCAIKDRCLNPNSKTSYPKYGGRGITICDRWRDSFEAFLEDMGERPEGTSIDRIDNNKGYEPGNCRWADKWTQSRNRRNVTLDMQRAEQIRDLLGIGACQRKIAKAFKIGRSTVSKIERGLIWNK